MIAAFLTFAAAAVLAASPEGAPADPPTTGPHGILLPSRDAFDLAYEVKAKALRDEMHALQKADGGELTAKHRAEMQEKLQALLSAYHRNRQQADPMGVNADGTLTR